MVGGWSEVEGLRWKCCGLERYFLKEGEKEKGILSAYLLLPAPQFQSVCI
jgi:hypothetical protein